MFIILALIIGGAAVYFILRLRQGGGESEKRTEMMNENMKMLNQNVSENLNRIMVQLNDTKRSVDARLKENAERLDNAAKVVSTVQKELGKLSEATTNMIDIGKNISSLQEIMRAPKIRGGIGEYFLEQLLSQVFVDKKSYTLQYEFKSGEKVDAVIHLQNGIVPIDSKFPLENFRKLIDSRGKNEEKDEQAHKKLFTSDVKKHIDAIAKKYILPGEGTLEFALMYIPAENVYYEIAIKDNDLAEYALSKKVIPVSPNTFYIYLQTLLIGLRGLQLEKNTKDMLSYIMHLQSDFGKFSEEYELVGKHLSHAKNSYETSEKRLGRLSEKLSSIEGDREHSRLKLDKAPDKEIIEISEE